MNYTLFILIGSQLLFTTSDVMARMHMSRNGFHVTTFLSLWFLIYVLLRTAATFGQLYVFTNVEVGKTMALFGAASIILANVLGLLVLKEVLSPIVYVGVSLAVIAFLILAVSS